MPLRLYAFAPYYYIGESTRREIEYSSKNGKGVNYLVPDAKEYSSIKKSYLPIRPITFSFLNLLSITSDDTSNLLQIKVATIEKRSSSFIFGAFHV